MDPAPNDSSLDYELLKQIEQTAGGGQRELARGMGVSVGKINYLMRAVISRGWVKVNNFRRADNKLAYAYLLTPTGVHAKMQLAQRFLAQKEKEFERLQRELHTLRDEVAQATVDSDNSPR